MATVSEPKVKNCDRCGVPIIWNNSSRFFESVEFPKFKHCCRKKCNKEGCGVFIYFSNIAPKNPETGNAMPLDFPIPQRSKTDSARMEWIPHVHRVSIPTDETTVPMQEPAQTQPLPQGQNTLEYTAPKPVQAAIQETVTRPELIAQTANQDVDATLIQGMNDLSQRLGELERFANEEMVPAVREFIEVMNAMIPKLNVIVGKIAEGSITSARDLVQHNLKEQQES